MLRLTCILIFVVLTDQGNRSRKRDKDKTREEKETSGNRRSKSDRDQAVVESDRNGSVSEIRQDEVAGSEDEGRDSYGDFLRGERQDATMELYEDLNKNDVFEALRNRTINECRENKKDKRKCKNLTVTGSDWKKSRNKKEGGEKIFVVEKNRRCSSRTLLKSSKKKDKDQPKQDLPSNTEDYHECLYKSGRLDPQTCYVKPDLLCDGTSACVDDECDCDAAAQDVFYCSDGRGCVAMNQVCDGQADCLDQSDECVCESYLRCETERVFSGCKSEARRVERCGIVHQGTQILPGSSDIENQANLGLFNCMIFMARKAKESGWSWKSSSKSLKQAAKLVCRKECQPLENHCEFIDWNKMQVDPATKSLSLNYSCGDGNSIPLSSDMDVCDGYNDCPNHADETFCASRFYCQDGTANLPHSKVCDSVPDCPDLSDECQSCVRDNLADEKHMISNKYLSYYMIVLCLLIVVLNCRGLHGHAARIHYVRRHNTRIDGALCTQLSAYDGLMGIYLLIVILKNFQFDGKYCLHDSSWRSSPVCNLSGFIFTLSSHGSLMTVLMMGVIRCYNCENMLAYFSIRRFLFGLTLGNILNVLCSAVVLLPTEFLENVFVTAVLFQDNRLLKKGTRRLIDDLLEEYYGANLTQHEVSGWSSRLHLLSKITSNSELFVPTLKFGFFNQSPLCIQNLFSSEPDESLQLLKMLYVSFLAVVIVSFSVCYIWIVFIRFKSAVHTASPAFRLKTQRDKRKLSRKVTLVISSQLLAWIPIIIATILTLSDKKIPPDFYEMAAIVLIPLNSLLNPIFHSRGHVFKRAKKRFRSTQGTVVTQLGTMSLEKTVRENRPDPVFQRSCLSPLGGVDVGSIGVSQLSDSADNSLVGIDLK